MLKGPILHPQILDALARSGHGSKVLISDANFPHYTARGPNTTLVYLNLAPGLLPACDVLRTLIEATPFEAAAVMRPLRTGPYAMTEDPTVWTGFRDLLAKTDCGAKLDEIERMDFYDAARGQDVCLTIATGEQQWYANLLLTIGARKQ